jgi:NHLM bacteriocin system secretion protein
LDAQKIKSKLKTKKEGALMSKLFRQESLERLSSPERLDQLMQVVNPKAWVPLTAMGSLVVVATVWSVFGRIPLTVTGEGVLLQPHRVAQLQSYGQGIILTINVQSGALVKKGEILGTIDQSSLKQQLNQERQKLADLLNQNQNTNRLEQKKLLLEKRTLEQRGENLKKNLDREVILPLLREKNLELLEKNRNNLRNSLDNLERNVPLIREKSLTSLKEQRQGLTLRLQQIRSLLPTLKERLESLRSLLDKQLITGDAVLSAEQQFFENLSTIANLEAELTKLDVQQAQIEREYLQGLDNINNLESKIQEIEVQQTELQRQYLEGLNRLDDIKNKIVEVKSQTAQINQQQLESSQDKTNKVEEVRRKIAQLELQLADQGKIISQYDGRILEMAVLPGQVIQSGTRIGSIETEDPKSKMVSVTYFADKDGKQIKEGMTAQVTPSLVKRERYGGILGKVKEVSSFPVTTQDITAIIGNPELARQLSQEKAPIQVIAELQEDANTVSGYQWSSSNGPSQKLSPGTTTITRIKIGEIAPIAYLIPLFRNWTGIY